ncbi:MAG: M3 family metallopeptidase [Candidatus Krumholzibacteriota bacterium]|nr:M3 family metallopeptidase [Candidatus Krumholzibacteriota bacterium]
MKRRAFFTLTALLLLLSISVQAQNPFFEEFRTPFKVPPFDIIKEAHYLPAFQEGTKRHQVEIEAIANNPESPTFQNTIEALDRSGDLLDIVNNVFFAMNSANTNEEMQEIAKTVGPQLSEHFDKIRLNDKLFQRVKAVCREKDDLNLTTEEEKLLEEYYNEFIRGGADLNERDKAVLIEINKEIAVLILKFGENVLKENNAFELVIDNEEDLVGLPEAVVAGASETAAERGYEGKWVFTLHKPSMVPFLQYSAKRDLREKIYRAYLNRGDNDNEWDNKKILAKIVSLRVKKANLLGYKTHAHFVLEENMAQEPDKVYDLLRQLWKPALKKAKEEARLLQKMIDEEGGDFKLESWDWWYYAEKVKKAKYDLDEESLKPYFQLENVIQGAFTLANKLYGITLEERPDLPKYHEDVRVFEVKEADGSHIGILYTDYFPRESKRGGAWMGAYRKQSKRDGKTISPVICNVGNFSKPTKDKPALLSYDEVLTLFHEFGHGLHGLFSNCTYRRLSGTEVATDFVELPSQIMENWVSEPEMLALYAKHYRTGEVIPWELVEKMKKASHFNQGFALTEYLAASFLDMDWHTVTGTEELDVNKFERQSMKRIGLIPEIISRYRSTYFRHIFANGYSAGYYSYIWAEVLDADAFEAFKEKGIFDRKTAQSFRDNIVSRGGTEDPMTLYVRFRGAEPKIDALLERRGLN